MHPLLTPADVETYRRDGVVLVRGLMRGQMNSGRRFINSHFTAFIGMPGAAQGEVMP